MGLKKLLSIGLAVPISVTSALVFGVSHASSADLLALNPMTVDCGDGSQIHANVDLPELTKLQGVMQGMVMDPTNDGTCSLHQDSQLEEHESHPFVIGAGAYGAPLNCQITFKIKASVDENGVAHGFQRASSPHDNCGLAPPGEGHIKATVTCLAVVGKLGEMRGIVTESTGAIFVGIFGIKPGDVFYSDVRENPPGIPDEIAQFTTTPGTEHNCVAQLDPAQSQPLDRGDIDVHD